MRKKIRYKNSYIMFTTDLTSTIQRENSIDWEAYTLIDNIYIDDKDPFRETLCKLLNQTLKSIFEDGDIYVRLYLKPTNDICKDDDFLAIILSFGFEQVSKSETGRMFVLINE